MIIQQIITILNDLTQRASSRRGLEQSLYNHSDKVQPKVLEISVRNQMQWTISVRSDRNLWSTLTGCVISVVRTEMSPSMIVVPSTALPYPALYKNNNQTLGGFGRVFATGMYRSIGHVWNFQTWFQSKPDSFLNGKRPRIHIRLCYLHFKLQLYWSIIFAEKNNIDPSVTLGYIS